MVVGTKGTARMNMIISHALTLLGAAIAAGTYAWICGAYFLVLRQKRMDFTNLVRGETIANHVETFGKLSPNELFLRYHNAKPFVTPILLCILTILPFLAGVIYQSWNADLIAPFVALSDVPDPALAGLAGAYIWSHYDIIRRYTVVDLSPTAYYLSWLRLLVGLIGGQIASFAVAKPLDILVAFGIGVFPLDVVRTAMEARLRSQYNIQDQDQAEGSTLHKLQGMTRLVIDRLSEEGIQSVQQLAYANPVRLWFRTNIEWTVILDVIDQSLLYIYVEDRIGKMRELGFRSATEFTHLGAMLGGNESYQKGIAWDCLNEIANALDIPLPTVRRLLETLIHDPQVEFVWSLISDAHARKPKSPEEAATVEKKLRGEGRVTGQERG